MHSYKRLLLITPPFFSSISTDRAPDLQGYSLFSKISGAPSQPEENGKQPCKSRDPSIEMVLKKGSYQQPSKNIATSEHGAVSIEKPGTPLEPKGGGQLSRPRDLLTE